MACKMSVGKLGEFNLSSGTWSTYIDRMEQYFLANDVKVNLQVPTLLACVGDATYELMVDLCSPKKPGDMKFSELVHLVKKHIQPTPSILAERYKFRKRTQAHTETVAQFAAALKHLARDCDFKENLEENLRDQFVCGLHSEPTRQRLFCEDSVTFSSAFKKAVALEAAANDAAAVEQRTGDGAVHAVHAQGARPASAAERAGAGPRWRSQGSGGRGRSDGDYNDRRTVTSGGCFCCGSRDHTRAVCRFQNYTCRVCLRPGHLQRVCPREGRKAEDQVLRLDTTRQVDEIDRSDDSDGERESSAGYYDDMGVGGPGGLYMVQLTGSDPVVAEVTVANRRLAMHVDTGSPISCIGDKTYAEMFPEYELQDNSCCKLKGYDGSNIQCFGYITVPVKYGVISGNLKLYIILKGVLPLLGREWIQILCMSVTVPKSVLAIDKNNKGGECDKDQFISKYPGLFNGKLGQLRSQRRATLRVWEGTAPVFRRARPLPLALRADKDAELQRMEAASILEPVPSSDWALCLVVVNPTLEINKYPLPRSEVLFNNLNRPDGGKRFTKIDLSHGLFRTDDGVRTDDKKAFQALKVVLTSCPVLMHYEERLPLALSYDASARGEGEWPVSYASRTLSSAEANYSQIQREALAIIFAVKVINTYLYGRKFMLRTDQQQLVIAIFGSNKDIPYMASGWIIRWAILLSGYQDDIEYEQSKADIADALPRLPIKSREGTSNADTFIKFIENKFPIDSNQIRVEKINLNSFLQRLLLDYRNSSTTEETPVRLMFGSHLGSRFDLLQSKIVESVSDRFQERRLAKGETDRSWVEGNKLRAKNFRKNRRWGVAKVINRKGRNMYEVETEDGLRWTRHSDQLRSSLVAASRDSTSSCDFGGQPTVSAQAALADYSCRNDKHNAKDVDDTCESRTGTSPVQNKRDPRRPVRFGYDDSV